MSELQKISINSLETGVKVIADFNPKELSFSKAVGWNDDKAGVGTDYPSLQFTAGQAITLSVELLFDQYETGGDVRGIVASVMSLALVDKSLKRPPMVQLLWAGKDVLFAKGEFTGVVDSVQAKYTMFHSTGAPCRASVTIALKQADRVTAGGGEGGGTATTRVLATYGSATELQAARPDSKSLMEAAGKKIEDLSSYPVTLSVPAEPIKDDEA